MKIAKVLLFLALGIGIGFLAARWSAAQSANNFSSPKPATAQNNLGMDELVQLLSNLEETKQTNTSRLFSSYLNASLTMQHLGDLSIRIFILKFLHEGRSNEAINMLENQLDSDIIGFAASYRDLTSSQREKIKSNLKVLQLCHDYRSKFPHKWPDHPEMERVCDERFQFIGRAWPIISPLPFFAFPLFSILPERRVCGWFIKAEKKQSTINLTLNLRCPGSVR